MPEKLDIYASTAFQTQKKNGSQMKYENKFKFTWIIGKSRKVIFMEVQDTMHGMI